MAQMTKTRTRSQQWFERAQKNLIEGVNSPSRGKATYSSGPIFLERGRGSHVWDADNNQYVDFMMSFGALIHGHAHPKLVSAVSEAMAEGSHFAAATSAEVAAAERFCRMVPSAEAVRFTNTGSEATMLALRLARAHTGRNKFLKFEGHYHGWYDPFLLNAHGHAPEQLGPAENPSRIPDSAGIPPATFDDVVLAPWNDVAALDGIMQNHGRDLAAVITEPIMANMGCIPPREGYLHKLRELTLWRAPDPRRSSHRISLRARRMPAILWNPARHQHLRQGTGSGISGWRRRGPAIDSRSHALERKHGSALRHFQWAPAHHESGRREP